MNKLLAVFACLVVGVLCDEPEHIVLGMGCFFKAKRAFEEANASGKLKLGNIEQGYAGGFYKNPDFLSVMRGKTGHAEVLRLTYRESEQPLQGIMSVFWHGHDPTSQHIQGDEVGSQYRSIVLYETDKQNATIFASLSAFLAESEVLEGKSKIMTDVLPLEQFWPAEANLSVIAPEVEKIIKKEHEEFVKVSRLEKKKKEELIEDLDPSLIEKRHLDKARKEEEEKEKADNERDEKEKEKQDKKDHSESNSEASESSESDKNGESDSHSHTDDKEVAKEDKNNEEKEI